MSEQKNLRKSAGAGLIWGVGFTLARDVVQFLAMIVMVRLLSPEIYGQAALGQAIVAFIAVFSLKTLGVYALQVRDPDGFDWDTHFSVGAWINLLSFAIANAVALGLYIFGDADARATAGVVALMSLIFPIEIISTYYFVWLQAYHSWARMRLLLIVGAIAASAGGVFLALCGAGVFALVATNLLASLPITLDFLLFAKQRPKLIRPRFSQYREAIKFWLNRIASASLSSGVSVSEQSFLTSSFGFASLGTYTRANGLAQLTAGRIGPVVIQTLYPVLTRADAQSERFRRFSATLLQGVMWASIPAAAFLALEASPFVELLYGSNWRSVAPLLPWAAALMVLRGFNTTLYQVMLANLQQSVCIVLDVISSIAAFVIIFVAIPYGIVTFLAASIVQTLSAIALASFAAARGGAIDGSRLLGSAVSCAAATTLALATLLVIPLPRSAHADVWILLPTLFLDAAIFGLIYLLALRVLDKNGVASLLDALPLPQRLRRMVCIATALPAAAK